MQSRKLEIVTELLKQLPTDHTEAVDQAMLTWWVNIRSTGGLRLTYHGYKIIKDIIGIESWNIDINNSKDTFTKRVILDLDKKLNWPYYINTKTKQIEFFSSREAMMATLYGDIKQWLKNY